MQMENIFTEHEILTYFFDRYFVYHINPNLLMYLYDNLKNENYETLRMDLEIALTNNVNGEYIW
jgi:hypothetical protein